MHAAIFDIDGTLIDSWGANNAMYGEAIRQALGAVTLRNAWSQYARVTDTGVLAEVCSDNGLHYDDALSDKVMRVYYQSMLSHMEAHGPYRETPGALRYLSALRERTDTRVAYATGGWRTTAEHKLRTAGFPLEGVPLASANDHHGRPEIMRHALDQLGGPFDTVTYFGDGAWDQAAAAQLGWRFVAVGPRLNGVMNFGDLPLDLAAAWSRR